jgi:hypothetical protein
MAKVTTYRLDETETGGPRPLIEIRMPRGTHYRMVSAKTHELAAKIERLSYSENWIVIVRLSNRENNVGYVYLELMTESQVEIGEAVMRSVARGGS